MVIASNPKIQQSAVEETVFTSGVPPESPADSNGFRQLYQASDEPGSPLNVESSRGISVKVPKPGINGQAYLVKPTLNYTYIVSKDKTMAIAPNPDMQQSVREEMARTNGVPSKSATDSNGFRQQLYQIEYRLGSMDRRSSTGSSKKLRPGTNGHAYPADSNGHRPLYQACDEPCSPMDLESSIESSEKMPKPGTNGQSYFTKPILDDTLKTAIYEKTLAIADSLSKVISNKNCAVSIENPITPFVRSYNGNPFSKTVSNCIIESSLSEETESNGKFPVVLESNKSRDAEKFPSSLSATNGIKNLFNNNGILPVAFPEFPFNIPVSKIDDTPIIATENIKIPDFQEDCEKSTHSGLLKREALSGGGVISSPRTPCTSIFSNFNASPVSLPKTNSTELPKRLYQDVKPPILIDMNSSKSLPELLLILENWGRKGLDKAFNMTIADIGTHFTKDLHYGLDLMKQIITRICTLMTAANHLPDPDQRRFVRGKNRVRGDLISTGITVWLTINDLELSVIQTINNMATDPGTMITDLYKKVTDNLSLLSKRIEDFQDKIHVFCSEIEKLV